MDKNKIFKFQISNFKFQKGFTILEVVVVILVLSLGLTGILSLVSQNMQVNYVNKNMMIASQLAQEGLEQVRNIRDNNFLSGNNWKTGAGAFSQTDIIQDGLYSIDYAGITNTSSLNDNLAKLYIDSNGFYRHMAVPGSATTTIFSRVIQIDGQSTSSTTISCIVQWKRNKNNYLYSAQTVFYNWR